MWPEVAAAMAPFLADTFGNASGSHAAARAAKTALEEARELVAELLGAGPDEILFTGSGTESDNLAVKGAARAAREAGVGDGVVTTAFEHKAVLASVARLERDGFRVARTSVLPTGLVDLERIADALDDRTVLVSVMAVNNEVGTIQPLAELAAIVRDRAPGALLHTDAVQAVPWIDLRDVAATIDLVSISAHKFGGPKGVGVLARRGSVPLEPLIEGGGQEWGLRSGTTNVAGVVGLATALRVVNERRDVEVARVSALRDRLRAGIADRIPSAFFNGDAAHKIAGNCHVGIPGVEAEALLVLLDQAGVSAAAGSSCTSGATEPSHVLESMDLSRPDALASIRLSLGYDSTDADVDVALDAIEGAVSQLRAHARASA
jgi:cysteine desulfurase